MQKCGDSEAAVHGGESEANTRRHGNGDRRCRRAGRGDRFGGSASSFSRMGMAFRGGGKIKNGVFFVGRLAIFTTVYRLENRAESPSRRGEPVANSIDRKDSPFYTRARVGSGF